MSLESATYVDDLDATNPLTGDLVAQGDDHLRLIKSVLKATFPNMTGVMWRVSNMTVSGSITPDDNLVIFNVSSGVTATLAEASTFPAGFMCIVRGNLAAGGTIAASGSDIINRSGVTSVSVPGRWMAVVVKLSSTTWGVLYSPSEVDGQWPTLDATVANVGSLSVSAVATLPVANVGSLSVSAIAALKIANVGSLSVSAAATLPVANVGSLSVSAIAALKIANVGSLSVSAAATLPVANVGSLSVSAVATFGTRANSPVFRETNITARSTSGTATNGEHTIITATGGAITVTLPASPTAGDHVQIHNATSRVDHVIGRNGQNIMSLAENLTIDRANVTVSLRFVDATRGWRIE